MTGHKKEEELHRSEEDWGSNVSLVSNAASFSCFNISIRIFLGILFLAAGVVAVVYSVSLSEKSQEEASSNFFKYSISQSCAWGNLSVYTIASDDGSEVVFDVTSTKIKWIQVADQHKLYFQFGKDSQTKYILFIFDNVAYNVTDDFDNCVKVPGLTYKKFFEQMGLVDLPPKSHTEQLIIENKPTKVNAYEGEPQSDVIFNGVNPSLIQASSDYKTDVTYRWEIFFPRNSTLSRLDFFFEDMQLNKEDPSIFDDLPQKCLDL